MRWLRFSIVVLIVMVLQTGNLLNIIAFPPLNIKPNFLLIMLVFFAINTDSYDAIITSFALGLACDISSGPLGPFFLSYGLLGSALAHLKKMFVIRKNLHYSITIFCMSLLTAALASLLLYLKGTSLSSNTFLFLLGTALYSSVVGPYINWPLNSIKRWLGIDRHRFRPRSG